MSHSADSPPNSGIVTTGVHLTLWLVYITSSVYLDFVFLENDLSQSGEETHACQRLPVLHIRSSVRIAVTWPWPIYRWKCISRKSPKNKLRAAAFTVSPFQISHVLGVIDVATFLCISAPLPAIASGDSSLPPTTSHLTAHFLQRLIYNHPMRWTAEQLCYGPRIGASIECPLVLQEACSAVCSF